MKTLTAQEKADLKGLIEHNGFRVLKAVIADFELDVLRGLKLVNLADEKQLKVLNAKQNFLLGAESLLSVIEGQSNTIKNKKFE